VLRWENAYLKCLPIFGFFFWSSDWRSQWWSVVNFTNILQAVFVLIFFCQKITKPNCNWRKVVQNTFVQKSCSENAVEIDTWWELLHLRTRLANLEQGQEWISISDFQNRFCQTWRSARPPPDFAEVTKTLHYRLWGAGVLNLFFRRTTKVLKYYHLVYNSEVATSITKRLNYYIIAPFFCSMRVP